MAILKNRLDNPEFMSKLSRLLPELLAGDEQSLAFSLLKVLEKRYFEQISEIKANIQVRTFFEDIIIKLKYLSLPLLDDEVIVKLFSDNFLVALSLENYDLSFKWRAKMLSILEVSDRDVLKEKCKKALFSNKEKITPQYLHISISDWLKDYVSKIGSDQANALQKSQYLSAVKNNKDLSEQEESSVFSLINFFNILSLSSASPEGVEDEAAFIYDNKRYVLRHGILEALDENKSIAGDLELFAQLDSLSSEQKIDDIIGQEVEPVMAQLLAALPNYSPSSFEYKVIKQEIERLRKNKNNASKN